MNSHHDKLLQEGAQDDEPAQTSIQCTLCPSDSTHCFWTLQMKQQQQQQQQQQHIVTRLKQRIIGLQQTLPAFFLCLIQVQKRLQVVNRHRCWVCYLRTTNHFFKWNFSEQHTEDTWMHNMVALLYFPTGFVWLLQTCSGDWRYTFLGRAYKAA